MSKADLIAMAFSAIAFSIIVYDRWKIMKGDRHRKAKRKRQGGE